MEQSQDQPKRQYLWVNKNEASSSLTRGDRSESKAIFQFVQHQRSDVPHRTDNGRYGRRNLASRTPGVPSARSMQGRLRLAQLKSPPRYEQALLKHLRSLHSPLLTPRLPFLLRSAVLSNEPIQACGKSEFEVVYTNKY